MTVKTGIGALRRPIDAGYRGADYDFITAVMENDRAGELVDRVTRWTPSGRAAKSRAQKTQRNLLLSLVTGASNDLNADPQIGRTLFQLLVPIEMEAFLSGTTDLQIELDSGTAGHSVGAARHRHPGPARIAALGDPRQAAAQAAH